MILWLERVLWSGPLLAVLLGSHIYFTGRLGVQRWTLRGIRLSLRPGRGQEGVSSFGALATSLAAAIGTGNIVGVATAVALGGPGAVFWCWLTGVLGMATRYAETYLTLRYRRLLPDGTTVGGPMYVMEDRLRKPRLGRCFALLGVAAAVGTGSLIQSNAIAGALGPTPPWLTGLAVTVLAGLVILGGLRTIARVCEKLVPAMAAFYVLGCLWLLWSNRALLPETFSVILRGAFTPRAVGGGFVGSTILTAARYGTARGLFTNESGMGTAPMAAVSAPGTPVEEALVSMTGVFWDTVVICALTGLVLVSSMLRQPALYQEARAGALCYLAFSGMPMGRWVLTISLVVFAFATIVGWCWYGECCWRYLWGDRTVGIYRMCYLAGAFAGAFGGLETVWSLGSLLAGLMAVPNILCLVVLRREVQESVAALKPGKTVAFPRNSSIIEKRAKKEVWK